MRVSGVGPQRARGAARRLLADGAEALLSWGTATALAPWLEAGDVILPRGILRAGNAPLRVCEAWRK
ncbi:MAG TPA: purine phosphorylase, partial [Woeseiaceae bacterium]|nr:purine phosphorylase [Woeseiaceae bacterium]